MVRIDFQNMEEFGEWLQNGGVDIASWGQGKTKRLSDLWREYEDGESTFMADPIYRLVEVVQIHIRRGDTILIEVEQEFVDGRRRERLRPPAEKLKPGESPRAAALRCLGEELGLAEDQVILEEGCPPAEEKIISTSYPGLPTRYCLYTFEATTHFLPDVDFYQENVPGDPIRRHLWGWRSQK